MSPVRPLEMQYVSFGFSKIHNTYMRNSLHKLWSCGLNIDRFGGLTG